LFGRNFETLAFSFMENISYGLSIKEKDLFIRAEIIRVVSVDVSFFDLFSLSLLSLIR